MPEVAMPRLSDSMEQGTILRWLKTDGDAVAVGDELVEIETDKANMTYEAEAEGVLEIVAGEGDTLPVGAPIARLGEGAAGTEPEAAAEPEPEPIAAAEPDPVAAAEPIAEPAGNGAAKASPIAKRMARELGISLATVAGSGPGGRILKADIEAAASGQAPPAAATASPAPPAPPAPPAAAAAPPPTTAKGEVTVEEPTRTQQTIARRMAESKATAPEFVVAATADMEAAVALRAQLKQALGTEPAPSFNDLIVRAAALALREFPRANGAYRDGRFELYSRVNVGIAVAVEGGLVVPTIFDADTKPVRTIAAEARALAQKVRSGAITPPEVSGGTFTVSNLGMYGMRRINPVINPPQAAILGVGELASRAVVHEGELAARHVVDLTLVCDHRILYGADAAQFLARIRALLESPLLLLL